MQNNSLMGTETSKTPLHKKLGIKKDHTVWVQGYTENYRDLFANFPLSVDIYENKVPSEKVYIIHLFATTFADLDAGIKRSLPRLLPKGMLWISWPKKISGIPAEINKFDVMKSGQQAGLIDVKVASINEIWSGHKFVVPLNKRKGF